jgi:probable F420-dependent oxidoreductase
MNDSTDGARPRFGLAIPNFRDGATEEGIDASIETAERLGWDSIWTTDHLLPDTTPASADYATIYEALATLSYAAGRSATLGLGTSVIVVPMRNAVALAREVASVDSLSGGRLTFGVGVGWSETEYANVGEAARFHRRGAYLDEAIAIWRHLWSGSRAPFHGRFHSFDDFAFAPLPAQGDTLPIWIGGRSEAAIRRAGRLGDGYHSTGTGPSEFAERVPRIRAAAEAAGRPMPTLSARCRVSFDASPAGPYVLAGTPDAMRADVAAFAAAGATLIVVDLREVEPGGLARAMVRFDRVVIGSGGRG